MTTSVYSRKAEHYARYRWDYSPAAIQAIFETARLSPQSVVADIGAGTGILTRHFLERVGRVYAIEPNGPMRRIAERSLQAPNCTILATRAEAIPLPAASVDLITAAQSIHWFDPAPTRREFRRILKPGGWLAFIRNYPTRPEIDRALGAILTPENGVRAVEEQPQPVPPEFYFQEYETRIFPFSFEEGWEAFFGSLLSMSTTPLEDSPDFERFRQASQKVFEAFSKNGMIETRGNTELIIGKMG